MKNDFVKSIQEDEIRDIFQYWLERCPPGGIPHRGSIDPSTIPYQYLPNLFLYEREESGRFRCKLVGTDLVRVMGRDDTGFCLDETEYGPAAGERQALFETTVATGRPVYCRYRGVTAHGQERMFSRILLPIASALGRPDQIFGMMLYGPLEVGRSPDRGMLSQDWATEVIVADKAKQAAAPLWAMA